MASTVFVFDFDGVIVDSVSKLYETYLTFLRIYGYSGNQTEFNLLNGPKLSFIISYLKNTYGLPQSEVELTEKYVELLSTLYSRVKLYNGIGEVFLFLKQNNFKIAISSSCKRKDILNVLSSSHLSHYVDSIVSGDDVNQSKPSPEIYLKIKQIFPNHEYYVIEDSDNGLAAANKAGMNTIFFNPNYEQRKENFFYEIHDHLKIKQLTQELELNCLTITEANEIKLKLIEHDPNFSHAQKNSIDKIWDQHLEKENLFTGEIVCYYSHTKEGNRLTVECFKTEYKNFFAQLRSPRLKLGLNLIGVSGIILDKSRSILFGKRTNVSEYRDFYELSPSGGVDPYKIEGDIISHEEQLILELFEETNINGESIINVEPFCFLHDRTNSVYDICSKIFINVLLTDVVCNKNKEYRDFEIVKIEHLDTVLKEHNCVPTSIVMLANL